MEMVGTAILNPSAIIFGKYNLSEDCSINCLDACSCTGNDPC
ncbi:MAG: hypothetical protein WCR30_03880 [Clostridia bacterium]